MASGPRRVLPSELNASRPAHELRGLPPFPLVPIEVPLLRLRIGCGRTAARPLCPRRASRARAARGRAAPADRRLALSRRRDALALAPRRGVAGGGGAPRLGALLSRRRGDAGSESGRVRCGAVRRLS